MRTLWFVAGGAAGVWATTRTRRVAESLTVDGIHDRLTGWFAGARVLREEFQAGRTERQTELREQLSLGPTGGMSGPEAITQGTRGADPVGESATVRVLPAPRSH